MLPDDADTRRLSFQEWTEINAKIEAMVLLVEGDQIRKSGENGQQWNQGAFMTDWFDGDSKICQDIDLIDD